MLGTFKPGDKLVIERIPFDQIQKGDLVIFSKKSGEANDFIVHRVVGIADKGLVTRGDNCCGNDRDLASEENIVGRVTEYDRRGKTHRAHNGRVGLCQAGALHGRLLLLQLLRRIFRGPYLKIRGSGFIARLWRPEIEIFQFETPDGTMQKYVRSGRTVAIYWQEENRAWLKHPYDLIIKIEAIRAGKKEAPSKESL